MILHIVGTKRKNFYTANLRVGLIMMNDVFQQIDFLVDYLGDERLDNTKN